jgi:glucosylceramidase
MQFNAIYLYNPFLCAENKRMTNYPGLMGRRFAGIGVFALFAASSLLGDASRNPMHNRSAWSLFETARDNGHRLASISLPAVSEKPEGVSVILCDPAKRFQVIDGFGGAFTESTGWVLAQLPEERRAAILRAYFDPKDGLGYNLCRTHINSCDFSLGSWSLDDTPGDVALRDFNLAPMRKWVLPAIHAAQAVPGASFRVLASPWSPPAWMKTNGKMTNGGTIKPELRDAWARFLAEFVRRMKSEEGIAVWGLTVQNEPAANQVWESCLYTAEEERDFVRDYLGPVLKKAGLEDVRLMILDHNRDILFERCSTILSDPKAAQYVWGTALHWYVSEEFGVSGRLHDAFPDKNLLFTEGCWEGGVKLAKWDRGERYARNIIGDLNNWVRGWIDWNMVLDITGGPNHVGNLCDAPVLADLKTGEVYFQTSFYAIGHFSKFIRPGAQRIGVSGGPGELQVTAFENLDGAIAVVVFNETDAQKRFGLKIGAGGTLDCVIPAHAIQTYLNGGDAQK